MLRGRECGRSRLAVITPTVPADWTLENTSAVRVNGRTCTEAEASIALSSAKTGVVSVVLEGEASEQEFEFAFSIANDDDLAAVDDGLSELIQGKSLTINAIEGFIRTTDRFDTGRRYRDSLANYFYGVLARERSSESGLVDSESDVAAYTHRFDDAVAELGRYDRPPAEAISGLVAFHYNHFDLALRKTRSPRVAQVSLRFAHLLKGQSSIGRIEQARDTASLDYILSDNEIERIIHWTSIPLDGTAGSEVAVMEDALTRVQPTDAMKLRIVAAEHHLAAGEPARGLRHLAALRHTTRVGDVERTVSRSGRRPITVSDSTSPNRMPEALGSARENEQRPPDPAEAPDAAHAGAPSKAGKMASVSELFEFAYSLKGKQVRVPQKVLKDIGLTSSAEQFIDDRLREQVASLIATDPLLAVPPRLLVALEERSPTRLFKLRIARLIAAGLRGHPLFAPIPPNVESEESRTPFADQTDYEALSAQIRIRTSDITAAELGLERDSMKPTERDRLRANAITSVALIASTIEEWNDDRLVEHLQRHLWRDAMAKPGSLRPRVAVTDSSAPEALGIVAQVFLDRAEKANRAAAAAEREATVAVSRSENLLARAAAADEEGKRLRSVIDRNRAEISDLQDQIRALNAQIDAERRDRVIDRSHHIDDYEVLRTRIMRTLGKQVDLLSDGLHAVRHQSYSVTEEYIERALDSLSKELHQLNDEGGS